MQTGPFKKIKHISQITIFLTCDQFSDVLKWNEQMK